MQAGGSDDGDGNQAAGANHEAGPSLEERYRDKYEAIIVSMRKQIATERTRTRAARAAHTAELASKTELQVRAAATNK